jgi:hypothetical protein
MNMKDAQSTLLSVFDNCSAQFPKSITSNIQYARNDPQPFKKQNTDIIRMRILPRKKAPVSFWSSTWCFYELGVGVYDGALTVGGVLFVQFPYQKVCGRGSYATPVADILRALGTGKESAFECHIPSGPGDCTTYKRLYRCKQFPIFSVDQATEDLCWLVSNTLPKFEALCA